MQCSDESTYLEGCASGTLNVSVCNCCAFTTWFDLGTLCSSNPGSDHAGPPFGVVNMDTYADAPFSASNFTAAMNYYQVRLKSTIVSQ